MAFVYPSLPVPLHRSLPDRLRCSNAKIRSSRRKFLQTALTAFSLPIIACRTEPSSAEGVTDISAMATPKTSKKLVWGYEGDIGPDCWAGLSEDIGQCIALGNQSPIDLSYRSAKPAGLPGAEKERPTVKTNPATFVARWREASPGAIHRSLQIEQYIQPPPPLIGDTPPIDTYTPPPRAAVLDIPDYGEYVLQHFHFHVGSSEHAFEGRKDDMEAHFVFQKPFSLLRRQGNKQQQQNTSTADNSVRVEDSSKSNDAPADTTSGKPEDGDLQVPKFAVIAVLFRMDDTSNPFFNIISKHAVPTLEAAADFPSAGVTFDLDLSDVFPNFETEELYNYMGSLTMPPCSPNINWTVVSEKAKASKSDMQALMEAQGGPNVRPLQPLDGRKVTRFVAQAFPGARADGTES